MKTPSDWVGPVFLMNFPLSVSNDVANNAWMEPWKQGAYDKVQAGNQWLSLYQTLTENALVYVLPGHGNYQDLPFVANLACYLPHIKDRNVILLSKFTSLPRVGEEVIGQKFFNSFDYDVYKLEHCWEGEADLKWLRGNQYVGGIGSRSTKEAYKEMRETFNMEVLEINLIDPKLYHLDCVFFPLNEEKALVNVGAIKAADLKKIEKVIEVIAVPVKYTYNGWTNLVCINSTLLHALSSNQTNFEKLVNRHGFDSLGFDLSEFDKSGADLSCCVMHLNYKNRS